MTTKTRPNPIDTATALLYENERRTRQDHDLIPVSSLTDPLAQVAYLTLPDLAGSDVRVTLTPYSVTADALTFTTTTGRRADVRVSGSTLRVERTNMPGELTFRRYDVGAAARAVLAHMDPPAGRNDGPDYD